MVGTRVYIGGLPYGVRERDLERFFKGYGFIRNVLVKNGYGFVEFDDHRDADDAVYELNGRTLMGERVTVEKARGVPRGSDEWRDSSRRLPQPSRSRPGDRYAPPTRSEFRVTVENLSSRVSWQDLKDYMRQAGEVTYADANKLRRNEGVVEFSTYSDMKYALDKLDGTELNGRRIRLIDNSQRVRRRSRTRSRSHRRSRSRSRRRSRTRSHSRSRSGSRSKSKGRSKSHSRSRSASKAKDKSKSHSKSRSHSRSNSQEENARRSKSRSQSPQTNGVKEQKEQEWPED